MQTERRSFLKWMAILGIMPLLGSGLFAAPVYAAAEPVGCTDMDAFFDPDGWL